MNELINRLEAATGNTLNVIDLVLIVFLLVFTVRGIFKGLSGEIAGLAGLVVVLAGGWRFYEPLSAAILKHTRLEDPETSRLLAYILAVVVLLVAVNLVILLVRKVLHKVFDGPVERVGGAVAGFLKAAAVLGIVLFGVQLSGHAFLRKHFIEESWIGRTVGVRIPGWFDALREKFSPQPPNPEDLPEPEQEPPPGKPTADKAPSPRPARK